MTKPLLICLLTLLFAGKSFGQRYTFILVDVSKSITQPDLTGAREALKAELNGNSMSNASLTYGKRDQLDGFILHNGDQLIITRFGDKVRTLQPIPAPTVLNNLPNDLIATIDRQFSIIPTDQRTYLELAIASVAAYAKQNHIEQFHEILVTDNTQDDFGRNGRPDYTDDERRMVQSFGTAANKVVIDSNNIVKLSHTNNADFIIKFSSVDVSRQNDTINHTIHDTISTLSEISLLSFRGGKRGKEVEVPSGTVRVTWSCSNSPSGGKYKIQIRGYDGTSFNFQQGNLNNTSFEQHLGSGKYKIAISADNFTADSAETFIEVPGGSGGWLILFLILAAIIATCYLIMKRNRIKSTGQFEEPTKEPDIFTKGKSSPKNQEDSSKYF